MKLKKQTLSILQNFCTINTSLIIKKTLDGETKSKIRVLDKEMALIADAEVDEIFPVDIAIYNMNLLLQVVTSMGADNCEVDFRESFAVISDAAKTSVVKLVYVDQSLVTYTENPISIPEVNSDFVLSQESLDKIQKFSNLLGVPNIQLKSTKGKLILKTFEKSNKNSNTYSVEIGPIPADQPEFEVFYDKNTLKFIPGSYKVAVCLQGISKFESIEIPNLVYYVPHEQD